MRKILTDVIVVAVCATCVICALAFGGEYTKLEIRDGETWMEHTPNNNKGVPCTTTFISDIFHIWQPQDIIGYFVYFDSLGEQVFGYWEVDSNYCKAFLYNAWDPSGPWMVVAEDTVSTVDEVDTTLIDCSASGGLMLGQFFYTKFMVVTSDTGSVEDGIIDSIKAREFLRGILR